MPEFRPGLAPRVLALAALFAAEALAAMVLFELPDSTPHDGWLMAAILSSYLWTARCLIAFSALFATFAYIRYKPELARVSQEAQGAPIRGIFVAAHLAAIALFIMFTFVVVRGTPGQSQSNVVAAAWLAAAAAAVVCGAIAVIPWKLWVALVRGTGSLWAYTSAAALAAASAVPLFRPMWPAASRLTLWLVSVMAHPFVPGLMVQPDRYRIAAPRFSVIITNPCAGLEGIGLLLVFLAVWLILFRDEIRLPRALVLFPIGMVVLFLLNAVRITALILIGNAGARDIAAGGFHSQAGWMALNVVLFGLLVTARRSSWISIQPPAPEPRLKGHDATSAFLVPFLCVLAAGMLSRAASGTFEWLYGLRFFAAIAALWLYRRNYRKLDWRPDWPAPIAGAAVFALWIALDRSATVAPMPAPLASASPAIRWAWIAIRILGAVFTVPITEELAFRGYLLRRFVSADFEQIGFRTFTWFSLVASSVLFGLMHGRHWLAGMLAGLVYGLLLVRRGRWGDPVVAHGTTNALIAAYLLIFGHWELW